MKNAGMGMVFKEILTETEIMINDMIWKAKNADPDMVSRKTLNFFAIKENKNFFYIVKYLKNITKFIIPTLENIKILLKNFHLLQYFLFFKNPE